MSPLSRCILSEYPSSCHLSLLAKINYTLANCYIEVKFAIIFTECEPTLILFMRCRYVLLAVGGPLLIFVIFIAVINVLQVRIQCNIKRDYPKAYLHSYVRIAISKLVTNPGAHFTNCYRVIKVSVPQYS